jgi:hypothetical protein
VKIFLLILFFLICISTDVSFGQQTAKGSVKGRVKDVEKDYFLTNATVSLFNRDSTLLSFQITDPYGGFSFGNIQLNQPYYIEVSNVGYALARTSLTAKNAEEIDLGIVEMKARDIILNEVTIHVSPITMNGDTLEINPAAFKLDSNAVLEDMLRKVPNVTVWNDGQLTVNGREIKSLIVNGKPFFGGDFKVAMQNIPKNIVQTIQVYKKDANQANPLDSLMEMNVKLKKGKDFGFFGKFSGGLGTSGRFDAEGNLNIFSRKTQLTLVGAGNNTNKIAEEVNTLLNSSTFTGSGNALDYQTNFALPGENRVYSAGANIRHDFIDVPRFDNKSSFNANYFFQKRFSDEHSTNDIFNTLGEGLRTMQRTTGVNNWVSDRNRLSLDYNQAKGGYSFNASGSLQRLNTVLGAQNNTEVTNGSGSLTSASTNARDSRTTSDRLNANLSYSYNPDYYNGSAKSGGFVPFDVRYLADLSQYVSQSANKTRFVSYLDAKQNTSFDRLYDSRGNYAAQGLDLELQRAGELLFGKGPQPLNIGLLNRLKYERSNSSDEVSDLVGGQYLRNGYLSNAIGTSILRDTYGLSFSKTFSRRLSNRFEKNILLRFFPGYANMRYQSTSEKASQNISRSYHAFLPEANVSFYSHLFGRRKNDLSFNFSSRANLPSLDELAPLVDSSQVYYLRRGNASLNFEKIQRMGISFSHENLKTKNAFSYRLEGSLNLSGDKIVDSTFITQDNRQTVYAVNASGYQLLDFSGELRKAVKFDHSDLKLQLSAKVQAERQPAYINGSLLANKNLTNQLQATLGYGYREILVVELRESLSYYRSKQSFFNSRYIGKTLSHAVNLNCNIGKKTSLNTNVTLNSNVSSGAESIKYTIWNAYLSQRFLKGNVGEAKLSALDLLHQNTNVTNRFGANSFITTSRNVLQQYFMVSLSYYPRHFGKESR